MRLIDVAGDVIKENDVRISFQYFQNVIFRPSFGTTEVLCASRYEINESNQFIEGGLGQPVSGVNFQIDSNQKTLNITSNVIGKYLGIDQDICQQLDTGDVVTFDNGNYRYQCRESQLIKNKCGYKVSPGSIESLILKHESIEKVCVVQGSDGEIAAFIRLKKSQSLTAERLYDWCKKLISDDRCPTQIKFKVKNDFPLGSTGKVDWRFFRDEERPKRFPDTARENSIHRFDARN